MADFCRACSLELFGEDMGDLANITSTVDWSKGKARVVICEGCGVIQVDPQGNCVSKECVKDGSRGHGLPWVASSSKSKSKSKSKPNLLTEIIKSLLLITCLGIIIWAVVVPFLSAIVMALTGGSGYDWSQN